MKKFVLVMLLTLGVCAVSSSAFAVPAASFSLNMTDGDNSLNTVSNYTLKQQPWLHVYLPETGFKLENVSWTLPGGSSSTPTWTTTDQNNAWFTVSNWSGLTNAQKAGSWSVTGSYYALPLTSINPTNSGTLKFNVAPEPISATLFLLGGAGLAIRRFRGKKNS